MKKHLLITSLLISSTLFAYEIDIQKGPAMEAGPNSFFKHWDKVEDGTLLIEFLGGKEEIEKILVGTPTINAGQLEFSETLVKKRIEKSSCVNSKKEAWHYAPYTMGTIYWKDGRKHNFTMYLSGISVGGHLFALQNRK